jgi:membrane protease YdiL (CAAX protease family)
MIVDSLLSALSNLVILAGVPFLFYALFYKRKHGRIRGEAWRRAGLQIGETRYIWYCVAGVIIVVAAIVIWPPPLEAFGREGSAQHRFVGTGFGPASIVMALLYGVVATGFSEEFLFRGLIAGSLGRRLPLLWANLLQALIFTLPHLLILFVMPEVWSIIPVVFIGALFMGWVRIRSGSILGPWLLHAAANVTIALSIAARSVA